MEEQELDRGITFGEVCRLIGRRAWWTLGAAILAAALAAALLIFAVNPQVTYYSLEFELVYPTSAEQQYPDGTPFSYRTIVSRERLEEAKASDERFAALDLDAMTENDEISVSVNTYEDGAGTRVTYTVSVKGSYFRNAEDARAFISAVADASVGDIQSRADSLSYAISEETFNGNTFAARLDLLSEMYESMLKAYDDWIGLYSSGYRVTVNGTTRSLSDCRAELYGLYSVGVQENLISQCANGGFSLLYGADEELAAAVEMLREQLRAEYALNQEIIADLRAALASVPVRSVRSADAVPSEGASVTVEDHSLSAMLAAYLERNAMIECQIGTENTTGTLNVDEASAFARTLNEKYFTRLNDAAETLRAVTSAIYEQNTFAQFASRNVERSGEIGVSLVSVAVFVVVFLVGTIGVCVRQYHKKQAGSDASSGKGKN